MANYCESCGCELGSNANFCANCGASANGQNASYRNQNQTNNTAKTVATAAGTAIGVSMLGRMLHRHRRRPPMHHMGGPMHYGGHRGPGGRGGHGGHRGF